MSNIKLEMTPSRGRDMVARRRVVRGLVVLAGLAAVLVGVVGWRASGIIKGVLRDWAVATVAQQSGGVYRLDLGRVRLNWLLRRVTMDSVRLTTNVGANAKRVPPLLDLGVAFDRCTVSGVHLVTLVLGHGFAAGSFGCRRGSVAISGIPRPGGPVPPPVNAPAAAPRPPASVPRVRIARVDISNLALDVRLPYAGGGETRFALARAQWAMADFAIDPADSAAASRPLFSRTAELAADSFVVRPDSFTAFRVAHLRASLTDSTFDAAGIAFAPSVTMAKYERQGSFPPDVILISGAHVRMLGADFGALVSGSGVRARRLTVDSLHVKISSDDRGPVRSSRHRTPQQWIADLGETVDLDSVVVHQGEIEYRELDADQAGPGVLTFSHVEATAAPVHHIDGRHATGDSLIFAATAALLHAGRLDVRIGMPLDAPTFDMAFSGTLGPMPAMGFNQVIERLDNWRITRGQVVGISFGAAVHHGVASGTLTPRYTGLSIEITGHGSTGILGAHGIFGGAARGLASMIARSQVNSDNPGQAKLPRRGPITHVFAPSETLPAFLWRSLRDGLLAVLKK